MTIERNPVSGAWRCSTVHDGYLVTMSYFGGYTKREAMAEFRAYLKTL